MTEKDDDALIKAIDKFTKQAMVSQQGRMQRNHAWYFAFATSWLVFTLGLVLGILGIVGWQAVALLLLIVVLVLTFSPK